MQRKQQHCLCSQKCYKAEKNAGKEQNNSKKLFTTENKHSVNRKSPKGLQNNKTVQQEANLGNQASCQQSNNIFFGFDFKKKIDQSKFLNKKPQVYHWSRNSREFPELLIYWCCNATLTNQALPCVVIGLNQLREAYRAGLIPSEVTSKIAGSISVVNMIGLVA